VTCRIREKAINGGKGRGRDKKKGGARKKGRTSSSTDQLLISKMGKLSGRLGVANEGGGGVSGARESTDEHDLWGLERGKKGTNEERRLRKTCGEQRQYLKLVNRRTEWGANKERELSG